MNINRNHAKAFHAYLTAYGNLETEDFTTVATAALNSYTDSPEAEKVRTDFAAKVAAKAAKVKPAKVYPKDADGNEIKPKRGRPAGSKNKPKATEEVTPAVETTAVTVDA
jgi:hypothetical protein